MSVMIPRPLETEERRHLGKCGRMEKRLPADTIRIRFPRTAIRPSSCNFLSVREKVSGTVPSREASTFLPIGNSSSAPSFAGMPRALSSSER